MFGVNWPHNGEKLLECFRVFNSQCSAYQHLAGVIPRVHLHLIRGAAVSISCQFSQPGAQSLSTRLERQFAQKNGSAGVIRVCKDIT